jgi:hypothetical protein
MPTLKDFEDELVLQGMTAALGVLQKLRERERSTRSIAPARRVTGTRMTPELARQILALHASTAMTQQEIAFKLGVNQGRVNEVIKRGKWLSEDPNAPERVARDKALQRVAGPRAQRAKAGAGSSSPRDGRAKAAGKGAGKAGGPGPRPEQLTFIDL